MSVEQYKQLHALMIDGAIKRYLNEDNTQAISLQAMLYVSLMESVKDGEREKMLEALK